MIIQRENPRPQSLGGIAASLLFVKLIFFANIQKFHKKLDFLGANAYLYSEHI